MIIRPTQASLAGPEIYWIFFWGDFSFFICKKWSNNKTVTNSISFSCSPLAMYSLLAVAPYMFSSTITKSCISIYDSLFCIDSFLFIFRFTSQLKAVHGSHQGSSSSCARWRDHGIMRRHCILRCIAVHLFGIVLASILIYKDTMYRSFTPELFWSNTSVVVSLFLWTCSFVSQHTVADIRTVLPLIPNHSCSSLSCS